MFAVGSLVGAFIRYKELLFHRTEDHSNTGKTKLESTKDNNGNDQSNTIYRSSNINTIELDDFAKQNDTLSEQNKGFGKEKSFVIFDLSHSSNDSNTDHFILKSGNSQSFRLTEPDTCGLNNTNNDSNLATNKFGDDVTFPMTKENIETITATITNDKLLPFKNRTTKGKHFENRDINNKSKVDMLSPIKDNYKSSDENFEKIVDGNVNNSFSCETNKDKSNINYSEVSIGYMGLFKEVVEEMPEKVDSLRNDMIESFQVLSNQQCETNDRITLDTSSHSCCERLVNLNFDSRKDYDSANDVIMSAKQKSKQLLINEYALRNEDMLQLNLQSRNHPSIIGLPRETEYLNTNSITNFNMIESNLSQTERNKSNHENSLISHQRDSNIVREQSQICIDTVQNKKVNTLKTLHHVDENIRIDFLSSHLDNVSDVEYRDDRLSKTSSYMGGIVTTPSECQSELKPLEHIFGESIVVSEDGDYAIIDFEGERKEYKVNKQKLIDEFSKNNKIRGSKNLGDLFEKLEQMKVLEPTNPGESTDLPKAGAPAENHIDNDVSKLDKTLLEERGKTGSKNIEFQSVTDNGKKIIDNSKPLKILRLNETSASVAKLHEVSNALLRHIANVTGNQYQNDVTSSETRGQIDHELSCSSKQITEVDIKYGNCSTVPADESERIFNNSLPENEYEIKQDISDVIDSIIETVVTNAHNNFNENVDRINSQNILPDDMLEKDKLTTKEDILNNICKTNEILQHTDLMKFKTENSETVSNIEAENQGLIVGRFKDKVAFEAECETIYTSMEEIGQLQNQDISSVVKEAVDELSEISDEAIRVELSINNLATPDLLSAEQNVISESTSVESDVLLNENFPASETNKNNVSEKQVINSEPLCNKISVFEEIVPSSQKKTLLESEVVDDAVFKNNIGSANNSKDKSYEFRKNKTENETAELISPSKQSKDPNTLKDPYSEIKTDESVSLKLGMKSDVENSVELKTAVVIEDDIVQDTILCEEANIADLKEHRNEDNETEIQLHDPITEVKNVKHISLEFENAVPLDLNEFLFQKCPDNSSNTCLNSPHGFQNKPYEKSQNSLSGNYNTETATDDNDNNKILKVQTPSQTKVIKREEFVHLKRAGTPNYDSFSPDKITFLRANENQMAFQQKSKSLINLNSENISLSCYTLSQSKYLSKSQNMEFKRKKPTIILSASKPKSPRVVKETNIDELMEELKNSENANYKLNKPNNNPGLYIFQNEKSDSQIFDQENFQVNGSYEADIDDALNNNSQNDSETFSSYFRSMEIERGSYKSHLQKLSFSDNFLDAFQDGIVNGKVCENSNTKEDEVHKDLHENIFNDDFVDNGEQCDKDNTLQISVAEKKGESGCILHSDDVKDNNRVSLKIQDIKQVANPVVEDESFNEPESVSNSGIKSEENLEEILNCGRLANDITADVIPNDDVQRMPQLDRLDSAEEREMIQTEQIISYETFDRFNKIQGLYSLDENLSSDSTGASAEDQKNPSSSCSFDNSVSVAFEEPPIVKNTTTEGELKNAELKANTNIGQTFLANNNYLEPEKEKHTSEVLVDGKSSSTKITNDIDIFLDEISSCATSTPRAKKKETRSKPKNSEDHTEILKKIIQLKPKSDSPKIRSKSTPTTPLLRHKSTPTTPTLRLKSYAESEQLVLTKTNSWQFNVDYKLTKASKSLIESIEADIELEDEPKKIENETNNEIKDAIKNLRPVEDQKSLSSVKEHSFNLQNDKSSHDEDSKPVVPEIRVNCKNIKELQLSEPIKVNTPKDVLGEEPIVVNVTEKIIHNSEFEKSLATDDIKSEYNVKIESLSESKSRMTESENENENENGSKYIQSTSSPAIQTITNTDDQNPIKTKEFKIQIRHKTLSSDRKSETHMNQITSEKNCMKSKSTSENDLPMGHAREAKPKKLKPANLNVKRLSSSLHSVFTGQHFETDIDEVDDSELKEVLQSPLYLSSTGDPFETDVDKAKSKSMTAINTSTTFNDSLSSKSPNVNRRIIIVSKKEKRTIAYKSDRVKPTKSLDLSKALLEIEDSKNLFKSAENLVRLRKHSSNEEEGNSGQENSDKRLAMINNQEKGNSGCNQESILKKLTDKDNKNKSFDKRNTEPQLKLSSQISEKSDIYENYSRVDNKSQIIDTRMEEGQLRSYPSFKTNSSNRESEQTNSNFKNPLENLGIEHDDVTQMFERERNNREINKITINNQISGDVPGKSSLMVEELNNTQPVNEVILSEVSDTVTECKPTLLKMNTSDIPVNNSNRDSWDILEKTSSLHKPTYQTLKNVEQGVIMRQKDKRQANKKRESWNILDLTNDQNNNSNKRDSSNISYLFEKYQKERDALKAAQGIKRISCCSDFSEISSLSDVSSNRSSRCLSWCKDEFNILNSDGISSAQESHQSKIVDLESAFRPYDNYSTVSTGGAQSVDEKESDHLRLKNRFKPITSPKAELNEFPSPKRPDFVPEVSSFIEEDLGNIVLAKAASAVRNRRRSNKESTDGESSEVPEALNRDLEPKLYNGNATKTSDSGISEGFSPKIQHDRKLRSYSSIELGQSSKPFASPKLKSKENEDRLSVSSKTEKKESKSPSTAKRLKSFRASINKHLKHASSLFSHDTKLNENKRIRSYEEITSLPNLNFGKKLSSDELDYDDTEQFYSDSSIVSDSCFSRLEGSIHDDEVFFYPSLHLPTSRENTRIINSNSDSSDDESFDILSPQRNNRFGIDIERTVHCGNPPCSIEQILKGDQRSNFTSCPSCFTCYCSRACRRQDWHDHKRICFFGRLSYYIRSLIKRYEKDFKFNSTLKAAAVESYETFGRGCLGIVFENPTEAKLALISKHATLTRTPLYSTIEGVRCDNNKHSHFLYQVLQDYDPEQEFVVNISIALNPKTSTSKRKYKSSSIVRSARIPMIEPISILYGNLSSSYTIRIFTLPDILDTIIANDKKTRRYYCREILFSLKQYGVRLKADFKDAYEQLCLFVEHDILFPPLVLYGLKNGRNFKCIVYSTETHEDDFIHGEGALV